MCPYTKCPEVTAGVDADGLLRTRLIIGCSRGPNSLLSHYPYRVLCGL